MKILHLRQVRVQVARATQHREPLLDAQGGRDVIAVKDEVSRLADQAERRLAERLIADEPGRLETFALESEVIEYFRRVYYFAKRIARLVAEQAERRSRRAPRDAGPEAGERR